MTTLPTEQPQTSPQGVIVARAGQYYRNARYLIVAMLIGYALWSIRDGFFAWPKENEQWVQKEREAAIAKGQDPEKVIDYSNMPHPGWDVPFNQVIGVALPPLAIVILLRALYNSRGEYRLEGTTVHVPSHPPVPFENITEIDKRQWERKGIAYVSYDLGGGTQGRFRLDDFVYEREPTDEIFKRIEEYVDPKAKDPQGGAVI